MMRKVILGIGGALALGTAAFVPSAPAAAQGFSIQFGTPGYYGPPPPRYRPYGYGRPAYFAPPPRYRRCWTRPVQVWDGWGYVTEYRRVCR